MSNENRIPLNSLQSMFNLGNQPKINKQCRLNLRFKDQESTNALNRFRIRKAFGNSILNKNPGSFQLESNKYSITPFRASFNAGDINGSLNKAPWKYLPQNGSNQINLPRHSSAGDGKHTVNIPVLNKKSDASAYSGNPKFIYDSSDYIKFKKLQSINRNYNDITFGG